MPAPSPQSPALPGESHAAYSRRTIGENPSSPCTVHTMTFGGRCLRCGWGPASPHPTPAPLDLAQFQGFTPGPWHYPGTGLRVGGPDRLCVIEYFAQGERAPDVRIANLTLAAAAPALLAECQRQRAEIERLRLYNNAFVEGLREIYGLIELHIPAQAESAAAAKKALALAANECIPPGAMDALASAIQEDR